MSTPGDHWLHPWLTLVAERAGGRPVLELGCGTGDDTEVLTGAGLRVVALDLSAPALATARSRVPAPAAEFHRQDVRARFPASAADAGVVVASLSLHFFAWHETVALFGRIHDLLPPAGLLLCRLNSTRDIRDGGADLTEIEKDYYLAGDVTKRFFNRSAVEALLAEGWRIRSLHERPIRWHARSKVVWEVVAETL